MTITFITTIFLFLCVVWLFVLVLRERAAHHDTRKDLTEKLADVREQRDAVVRAVRWVPLKRPELAALAKTGCNHCHAEGVTGVKGDFKVCFCVLKAIAGRGDYGAMADGVPVRLATQAELDQILPAEKTGKPGHPNLRSVS